jgi:hypothetical protein
MQKEEQTKIVHQVRLGKRQCLSHKATESLAQGMVPSFNMSRLSRLFAASRVLFFWNDLLRGLQKVGVAVALPKFRWNLFPQLATSRGSTITDEIGYNLSGLATQDDPNRAFVGFFQHK